MRNLSVVIEQVGLTTPRELAGCLGVSVTQVQIALAAQGKFLLPDQQVDVETVLAFAGQIGLIVEDKVVFSPTPPGTRLKPNWITFQSSVSKRRMHELYHFTPLDNLPGIVTTGCVFSRRRMAERGIESLRNSWGSPGKEDTIGADYVCLSITNQWKMLSSVMMRLSRPPAVLVVAPRVIWYEGTCFSPKNSANRDIVASSLPTWTDVLHFDALFTGPDVRQPTDVQAEVLVRDGIPLDDVKKIAFHSQSVLERACEICGLDWTDPLLRKFCVKKSYYPSLERLCDGSLE